jgi:hypothetical protein
MQRPRNNTGFYSSGGLSWETSSVYLAKPGTPSARRGSNFDCPGCLPLNKELVPGTMSRCRCVRAKGARIMPMAALDPAARCRPRFTGQRCASLGGPNCVGGQRRFDLLRGPRRNRGRYIRRLIHHGGQSELIRLAQETLLNVRFEGSRPRVSACICEHVRNSRSLGN